MQVGGGSGERNLSGHVLLCRWKCPAILESKADTGHMPSHRSFLSSKSQREIWCHLLICVNLHKWLNPQKTISLEALFIFLPLMTYKIGSNLLFTFTQGYAFLLFQILGTACQSAPKSRLYLSDVRASKKRHTTCPSSPDSPLHPSPLPLAQMRHAVFPPAHQGDIL